MRLKLIAPLILGLLLPSAELAAQGAGDTDVMERARDRDDRDRERDRDDDERSRVTYSAIGLSRVAPDFENVEEAVSLDAGLGFRIPDVNWFAVQLDLGFTVIPGEVETESFSGGGGSDNPLCGLPLQPPCESQPTRSRSSEDFRAVTIGVFAVLRTPGRFYAMGKAGYRYLNTSLPEFEEDRSGEAYGGGLGYRYSSAGGYAEAHYTRYAENLDAIGFSLGYGFGGGDDD